MSSQAQINASPLIQTEIADARPYPPSYVDRLMDAVRQLPIPYWLTYLALFLLQSLFVHIVAWADGWLPVFTFNSMGLMFPLWLWGPLAIMTYLNSIARRALSSFSPLLDLTPEQLRRLEYEFTTMPSRSVILSSVFWAAVYFVFTYLAIDSFYAVYGGGELFTIFIFIEGLVSFLIGSAIYYHSIRQLRLVNQTVRQVKQFDLFRLEPVYAFSVLTSRTAIAWVVLLSNTLLTFPIQTAVVQTFVMLVVQIALAVAAFALPLWIVHQRLVAEKHQLEAEHNERVKSTLARLHRRLEDTGLTEMIQLNSALSGLNTERDVIAKTATWPWRSGLLTGFLSIVILPIILFVIQVIIGRMLNP